MPSDPTRYRAVHFIGGAILQARELQDMQDIAAGTTAYEISAIYRQGALFNTTVSTNAKTVSFTAADGVNPMLVFIRDKWEILKLVETPAVTLDPGTPQTAVYINWELHQITVADDPSLTDSTTGETTAEMGELRLSVSNTDTSGLDVALDQYDKNRTPIILIQFVHTSNGLTPVPLDNVSPQSLASDVTSGLVHLSTGTSVGEAVANDDPRNSNMRVPIDASVTDVKVYNPTPAAGNNSDGTPIVTDSTGVSAIKIVLQASSQTLEAGWNWLKASFLGIQSRYNAHEGAAIGLGNTHPMPTADLVGATPLSHVGQPLGLSTSHPPIASKNTGGFQLIRDIGTPPVANDPAFSVQESGANKASLNHDGDIYSNKANATTGSGSSLGLMSTMALVLANHVNQTSHANPHGIVPSDIGATTSGYVDSAVSTKQNLLGFTPVQQGGPANQGANAVKIGWATDGSGLRLTVDATDEGKFAMKSDITTNPIAGLSAGIVITSGSVPKAAGSPCTVSYGYTYANPPVVLVSPNNDGAAGHTGGAAATYTMSTSSFIAVQWNYANGFNWIAIGI